MKFKLTVNRVVSFLLLVLSISLLILSKNTFIEAYDLWQLGEPSTLYYMESTIDRVDLENHTVTVSTQKPEVKTLKLSLIDDYRLSNYLVGSNTDVICDEDRNIICLYSYYFDTIKLAIVLVGVVAVLFLFSFIILFLENTDDDYEDYDYEEDESEDEGINRSIEYSDVIDSNTNINKTGEVYNG